MLLFILRYERPFFKLYFIWLAPRRGTIKQNKPAFCQLLHGSPICYQIILTRLCLITSRFEPDLFKIIFQISLIETNWMQSAILMVPYVQRPFDFSRQIATRKNEGFLSAVYSFFHLFKTIDFEFAFINRTSAAIFQTTGREVKTGLCDKRSIWPFKTEVQDLIFMKTCFDEVDIKSPHKAQAFASKPGHQNKDQRPGVSRFVQSLSSVVGTF